MALFKTPRKSKEEKLARLSSGQRAEVDRIEQDAIANFKGQFDELEAALGMLRIGHHVGWKVLYIIHSKSTIRKYEKILGVQIREVFPETGPSSYRSLGFQIAMAASNFWKFVSGESEEAKKLQRDERRRVEA